MALDGLCLLITSGNFSPQDCEKPGSFCLTLHCNLSALPKEESRTINLYMLLNTEILKKVSPRAALSAVTQNPLESVPRTHGLPLIKLSQHAPLAIRPSDVAKKQYQTLSVHLNPRTGGVTESILASLPSSSIFSFPGSHLPLRAVALSFSLG